MVREILEPEMKCVNNYVNIIWIDFAILCMKLGSSSGVRISFLAVLRSI